MASIMLTLIVHHPHYNFLLSRIEHYIQHKFHKAGDVPKLSVFYPQHLLQLMAHIFVLFIYINILNTEGDFLLK